MKTFKRIEKLAKSVAWLGQNFDKQFTVSDVGTDHGYLAEKLSKNNKICRVLATDISPKSLSKLEKLIKENGLKKIETFVGDGLDPIDGADVCVIAGIGGFEIITILRDQNKRNPAKSFQINQNKIQTKNKNLKTPKNSNQVAWRVQKIDEVKCRYFVLQPAQNAKELREFLFEAKIKVLSDRVIMDARRFYPIIIIDVFEKQKNKPSVFNLYLGRDNKISDNDFKAYLLEVQSELLFLKNLPKKRIFFDKTLRKKYKLFLIVEKLLKV